MDIIYNGIFNFILQYFTFLRKIEEISSLFGKIQEMEHLTDCRQNPWWTWVSLVTLVTTPTCDVTCSWCLHVTGAGGDV